MEIKAGTWLVYCKDNKGGERHFFLNIGEGYTTEKLEDHLDGKYVDYDAGMKDTSKIITPYVIVNMVYVS